MNYRVSKTLLFGAFIILAIQPALAWDLKTHEFIALKATEILPEKYGVCITRDSLMRGITEETRDYYCTKCFAGGCPYMVRGCPGGVRAEEEMRLAKAALDNSDCQDFAKHLGLWGHCISESTLPYNSYHSRSEDREKFEEGVGRSLTVIGLISVEPPETLEELGYYAYTRYGDAQKCINGGSSGCYAEIGEDLLSRAVSFQRKKLAESLGFNYIPNATRLKKERTKIRDGYETDDLYYHEDRMSSGAINPPGERLPGEKKTETSNSSLLPTLAGISVMLVIAILLGRKWKWIGRS